MPRSVTASVANRWSRPISIGCFARSSITQAPSQSTCVGQTRAQLAPSTLASRIVRAAPVRLSVAIFLMKAGTSMPVGQAAMQGASKQ